jgi:hypothetical protein
MRTSHASVETMDAGNIVVLRDVRWETSSKLIPDLDISDLSRRVLASDPSRQTETIRAYRKALRAR